MAWIAFAFHSLHYASNFKWIKNFLYKNKSAVRMDIDAIVYHGIDSGILNIAQCSILSSEKGYKLLMYNSSN